MDRTLVAVFDSRDEAEAVARELASLGLAPERIQVRDASAADLGRAASSGELATDPTDRRGFFERLFGGADEQARYAGHYSEAIRRGSAVVIVDAIDDARVDEAAAIMTRHGAVDIDERAARWSASGWTGYDASAPALSEEEIRAERERVARERQAATGAPLRSAEGDTTRIPVVAEELQVGKRAVAAGGVRVFTRVAEIPVEENVQLRDERARVERRAVDRPATEADLQAAFQEGSIEVRETEERAVVSKSARVIEEVEVGKDVQERTETVRDTVRRTEVEVEDLPASRTGGTRETGKGKPTGRG